MAEEKFDKNWEIIKSLRRAQKELQWIREIVITEDFDNELQDIINKIEDRIEKL
jgi:hypothetical protein